MYHILNEELGAFLTEDGPFSYFRSNAKSYKEIDEAIRDIENLKGKVVIVKVKERKGKNK